jgi:hypothetical protein
MLALGVLTNASVERSHQKIELEVENIQATLTGLYGCGLS